MTCYRTRFGKGFYEVLASVVRLSGNPVKLRFRTREKALRFRKDCDTWLTQRGFTVHLKNVWVVVSR